MKRPLMTLIAATAVAIAFAMPGTAKTMTHHGKEVMMYQAAICHMYFTPSQAKKYAYACPISKGTMHKVMVSPQIAKIQEMKTDKALMGKTKHHM